MFFWEDLLEACNSALLEQDPNSDGIQRRQLFQDISFMESEQGWAIPLERYRHGRKVYYRYADLSFSINNQPLNEVEVSQVKSALALLSRFTGTPQFEWVNEVVPVVESKLGLVGKGQEVIAFDSNIDLKGMHHLSPLFKAIINERVLTVTYKDFKSLEPYDIIFHPHYIKQYNNRWFVFGLNEGNEKWYWNMALDRIEDMKEITLEYRKTEVDWGDYFYDIIGVTRPQDAEVEEVVLLFSPQQAPYVVTKPLHPTQRHKETAEGLEVRIRVVPNYELERLILSFGESVRLLAPKSLQGKVAGRIHQTHRQYLE